MEIIEHDTLDGLVKDMAALPRRHRKDMIATVRQGIKVGTVDLKDRARRLAGPHGKNYYKRISSEMKLYGALGLISGEYGPVGEPKTEFVGVGFRHGHNHDIDRSADLIGPAFDREVRDKIARWFW